MKKYRYKRGREERRARKFEETAWLEYNFSLKPTRNTESNTDLNYPGREVAISRN